MCNFNIVWQCLVFAHFITLATSCRNPLGDEGVCKNINQCESIRGILLKTNKSQKELDFLRDSICGFEGFDSKICCSYKVPILPNECLTPKGVKGQCISVYNCSTALAVLAKPGGGSTEDRTFIEKSRCAGPGGAYYVCCPPEPPVHTTTNPVSCISATPTSAANDIPPFDHPEKCPSTEVLPDIGCCGVHYDERNRIYGGSTTEMSMYPWLAFITYIRSTATCGGSLISGRYVLTAAHCGHQHKIKNVRLGDYDITNEGVDCEEVSDGRGDSKNCNQPEIVGVETVYKHVEYSNNYYYNDIALIRLVRTVKFTSFIAPICLPSIDVEMNPANLTLIVAGWGATNDQNSQSALKQHVQIPYVNRATCKAGHYKHLREKQICAGGEVGKDSCKGDSGGPLMYYKDKKRYEVTGIVSMGTTPCGQDIPAVYTHVIKYLDWIKLIINTTSSDISKLIDARST